MRKAFYVTLALLFLIITIIEGYYQLKKPFIVYGEVVRVDFYRSFSLQVDIEETQPITVLSPNITIKKGDIVELACKKGYFFRNITCTYVFQKSKRSFDER